MTTQQKLLVAVREIARGNPLKDFLCDREIHDYLHELAEIYQSEGHVLEVGDEDE